MGDVIYHIIVIAVAALAVVKGFRRGFTGQISGILGFAFGTVSAHVFEPDVEAMLRSMLPGISQAVGAAFIYSVLAAVIIYVIVYLIFKIFTKVLRSAMQVFSIGMLDSILGSAFCLLKYMMVVSIIYNLILCVFPDSRLMHYAKADDGNVVEAVMLLAPGMLGCGSVEDLAHLLQLRDAKKISHNLSSHHDVILANTNDCLTLTFPYTDRNA